jgi:tetratricopeptide (TPR) repeat protein
LELAEESKKLFKEIGAENTNSVSELIADIAWGNGDYEKARSIYLEMQEHYRVSGEKRSRAECLESLGLLAMDEGHLDQARAYLEEGLDLLQESGHKVIIARCLAELSNLFYLQGNLEQFKESFKECLSLKESLDELFKTILLMTILGSIYLPKPEVSTQLLGTIDNWLRQEYFSIMPVTKRYCVRAEMHAREVLGQAGYKSAFAEGQKLSLDEALDLALKTVEEM